MATDATGAPTPLGIPKYNTSADAPSGLGFNAAMDSIDALIAARVNKPAGIGAGDVPVWNGTTFVVPSGARNGSKFLRDDGAWAAVGATSLGLTVSAANTDLAAPTGSVNYETITTAGGTLRSIGVPAAGSGSMLALKNTHTAFVRLLHATAGGTGAQLSIINAGHKFLSPGQSIQLVYDGTNWQEVNRPAMELIVDYTVTGAVLAAWDTDTVLGIASSIPQVYTHLRLSVEGGSDAVAPTSVDLKLNNDATAANYMFGWTHSINGAAPTGSQGNTNVSALPLGLSRATIFGSGGEVLFHYYRNPIGTSIAWTGQGHWRDNASGLTNPRSGSGSWQGNAAATRMALTPSTGNFAIGTRFLLEGVT